MIKMNLKITVLFLCSLVSPVLLFASDMEKENRFQPEKRHDIRISFSDGIPLSFSDFFGTALADALTGTERTDSRSNGLMGIGYRYAVGRWRVGIDFSFGNTTSKMKPTMQNVMPARQKNLYFLILPAGDMLYYKTRIVELYGSASIGVLVSRTVYEVYNDPGVFSFLGPSYTTYPSKCDASLAFQVNPIAIRLGNERVGGFLEAGVGYRGFVTAGISIRF